MKRFLKYVQLTLMGIVFSLPVLTFAGSLTAMHFAGFKLAEDENIDVTEEFMKSFKLNLKQSFSFLPVYLIIVATLVWIWITAFKPFPDISFLFIGLMYVFTLLLFNFLTMSSYMLSKFSNTTGRLMGLTAFVTLQKIDVVTKLSFFETIMVGAPAIIIVVNKNVIGYVIGAIVFVALMIVFEMLSSKAVLPIFEFLMKQDKSNEPQETEE